MVVRGVIDNPAMSIDLANDGKDTIRWLAYRVKLLADQIDKLHVDMPGRWHRSEFLSLWHGDEMELIVIQNCGSSENWRWTARGWREPGDDYGADRDGWIEETTRELAESAALKFYMQKDE